MGLDLDPLAAPSNNRKHRRPGGPSAIGSAVTTITKTITVAAGVSAPGHVGELLQIVPFDLADAVPATAGLDARCPDAKALRDLRRRVAPLVMSGRWPSTAAARSRCPIPRGTGAGWGR